MIIQDMIEEKDKMENNILPSQLKDFISLQERIICSMDKQYLPEDGTINSNGTFTLRYTGENLDSDKNKIQKILEYDAK